MNTKGFSPFIKKPKLIIIVGPTSSGKSELAVRLAKKFNGEIISADSRQVYRGLDIGTGKITQKETRGIPHHLLDVASPKKQLSAADFKKLAANAVTDISRREKLPIVAGGTGFWIDSLIYDTGLPEVPPSQKLRRALAGKTAPELLKILKKLDQKRAKTVEQKNPRRLIRAIEIAKTLGRVPKIEMPKYQNIFKSPYQTLWIGLNPAYEVRLRKIEKGVKRMVKTGLLAETKKLLRGRVSKKRIREFGFEYRAVLEYLGRKISKKELREKITRDSLNYARRQMVWFKRNNEIKWIKNPEGAERLCRIFLTKKDSGKK